MDNYTIIIPHHNGEKILFRCLESINKSVNGSPEIIIVDNASTDHSIDAVKLKFPNINIIRSEKNLGYAGGCNLGAIEAKNNLIVFLNNDTVLSDDWDQSLFKRLEDETISSVQPKIKNLLNKEYFDYAGASGGFLDVFCYPFCRGRIFSTIEKDTLQYQSEEEVFWASGAAFATKKNIFIDSGMFDTKFFAHMEEIDYHWRCQMMGYKVVVSPESVIYHEGGATLSYHSYKKTYFNHRNSIIMFLSNHRLATMLSLLLPRITLQFVSIILDIVLLKPHHAIAQFFALLWTVPNLPYIIKKRIQNRKIKVSNYKIIGMYYRSIVLDYFLFSKKIFSKLKIL